MFWMSWEDLREQLEEPVAAIDEFDDTDQTFWFESKEALCAKLHKTLDVAIEKALVEDVGDL